MIETPVYRINDFAIHQRSFYANTISAHVKKHSFIEKPHKHNHYLVVIFTQGSGVHEVDFNSYRIKPGSMFMLLPGQTHSWNLSDDIEGYIFFHSAEFYNLAFTNKQIAHFPFYSSWQNDPLIDLPVQSADHFEALFSRIFQTAGTEDTQYKFDLLLCLIDLLYHDVCPFYTSTKPVINNDSNWYQQKTEELNRLINRHFQKIKSPARYAEMMNISARHLNRIVNETFGKTTSGLIADRIVLEAKRLLVHGGKNIKQIANELGFDDASYFIRFFKKHAEETPAAFQKRYGH